MECNYEDNNILITVIKGYEQRFIYVVYNLILYFKQRYKIFYKYPYIKYSNTFACWVKFGHINILFKHTLRIKHKSPEL